MQVKMVKTMKLNKILFGKKINNLRQVILPSGAFIAFFIIAVILLDPYIHRPSYNFSEIFQVEITTANPSVFNWTTPRSDVYEIAGDVRIHVSSFTVFIGSREQHVVSNVPSSWTVKPYTRKADTFVMKKISAFKINYATYNDTSSSMTTTMPKYCNKILSTSSPDATPPATTPAIIFSSSGYTGNTFHDFDDIILPLYTTARRFNRSVLLLVVDPKQTWLSKYKLVFRELSRYDLVELKTDHVDRVLCFDRVIVGLRTDHERGFYTKNRALMRGFTRMLRNAYSLPRHLSVPPVSRPRPRMLVVSREVSRRRLVNEGDVAEMARGLGFEVRVERVPKDVGKVARLVNGVDVMVGVHGAGLTNMVFLPENASVVQIIPFGLVDFARYCFRYPSESMNLRYSEYVAELNESTLESTYSGTEINYADPDRMLGEKGFLDFRAVYLDNQDVVIDVGRFKDTLLKVLGDFRS